MTAKSFPDDVSSTERIEHLVPLGEDQKMAPNTEQPFSSFMQNNPGSLSGAKTSLVSPFDLAQQTGRPLATGPNFETLIAQIQLAQSSMGDLQNQLSYPNLKLKSSSKYILKNKLSEARDNIRSVNAKLNNPLSDEDDGQSKGPIAQFVQYVVDGMNQLESAKNQLNNLKNKGKELTPGDFLLIQIKMNKAQQLIDFTSILLSKAVDDFKMLMGIQL